MTYATQDRNGILQVEDDAAPGVPLLDVPGDAGTHILRTLQRAQDSNSTIISPTWWGAVGDGETDSADAFLAMRAVMVAEPDRHYAIRLPFGHYCYTKNWWLVGVRSFELDGNGSTLECISADSWGRNYQILQLQSPFDDWGAQLFSTGVAAYHAGYPIESVVAGSTQIAAITPADVAGVSEGDTILIGGCDQQFTGWPPNFKFFEYVRVVSVDSETGIIQLNRPLENAYRSDWWETNVTVTTVPLTFGAARFYRLRRTNYRVIEYARFANVNFAWNRNKTGVAEGLKELIVQGCLFACLDNVTHTESGQDRGVAIGVCQNVIVKDSRFGWVEADKIVSSMVFDSLTTTRLGGSEGSVAAATGVNSLAFRDCDLSAHVRTSPRNLLAENCRISAPSGYHPIHAAFGRYPTRSITVRNCQATSTDVLRQLIYSGTDYSFTIPWVGENNEIGFVLGTNPGKQFIQGIDDNLMLYTYTHKQGRVLAMYSSGGYYVIETDSPDVWEIGDKVYLRRFGELVQRDCTINGKQAYENRVTNAGWIHLTMEQLLWTQQAIACFRYLQEVVVVLQKAYSGASSGPQLRVFSYNGSVGYEVCRVDLLTTGQRHFRSDVVIMESSDSFKGNLGIQAYSVQLQFKTGSASLPVVAGEMPHGTISLFFA